LCFTRILVIVACVQSCAQLYPLTCRPPRPVAIYSGASSNTSYFIDAMLSLFDKHGCSEEAVSPRCWRHPPDPRVGRIAEPTRSTPRPPSHLRLGDLVRRRLSSCAAGDLTIACNLSLPLSRERGGRARPVLPVMHTPIANPRSMRQDTDYRRGLDYGGFSVCIPTGACRIDSRLASGGLRRRARGAACGRQLGREGGRSRRHQEATSC
jgi:hypothetical protein